MNKLMNNIDNRLQFGRQKYGHGVRVSDDMADYTRSKKDSFLEMQLEEILDGIIYTAASKLRWLNEKYGFIINTTYSRDNNSDIKSIILDVNNKYEFEDDITVKYDKLLSSMIKVYIDTISLQEDLISL